MTVFAIPGRMTRADFDRICADLESKGAHDHLKHFREDYIASIKFWHQVEHTEMG